MPTIAYIRKTLAKKNIALCAHSSVPNRWYGDYRGYFLQFNTNPGEQTTCNMSATKSGIPGAQTEYRDTLTGLLSLVEYLTRDNENPNLPAPPRAAGTNGDDAQHAPHAVNPIEDLSARVPGIVSEEPADRFSTLRAQFPTGSTVIITGGEYKGKQGRISAVCVWRHDPDVIQFGVSLDEGRGGMPYFQNGDGIRRIDADAPDAPRQSFRCVGVNKNKEVVYSASGWDWHGAFRAFLNPAKLATLSGEIAASVVAVGIITVSHFSDGVTLEGELETSDNFGRGFITLLSPRVNAYRELRRALTAFAADPNDANTDWLTGAGATYRATYAEALPTL